MDDARIAAIPAPIHSEEPSGRDRLFAGPRPLIEDFQFDDRTASVFDEMVSRSVPFYAEMQRMVGEMVADFAVLTT